MPTTSLYFLDLRKGIWGIYTHDLGHSALPLPLLPLSEDVYKCPKCRPSNLGNKELVVGIYYQ